MSDSLPLVRAETLVLQRKGLGWLDLAVGREMAASIPNARLVVLEGSSVPPFLGEMDDAAQAIESFLAEVQPFAASAPPRDGLPAPAGAYHANSLQNLSARQGQVLSMIVQGMTNREIAAQLVLSLRTVERHVNDIYARLGVRNRSEAVALTLRDHS